MFCIKNEIKPAHDMPLRPQLWWLFYAVSTNISSRRDRIVRCNSGLGHNLQTGSVSLRGPSLSKHRLPRLYCVAVATDPGSAQVKFI